MNAQIDISGITLKNPLLGGIFTAVESEKQQPLELLLAELAETGCIEGASDIRIEKIYDIRMTYKDRYEIVFGRSDQIESALAKLDLVIAELEQEISELEDDEKAKRKDRRGS